MRRHRPFILCLILALTGVSQGAFKFTAWADNRPSQGTTTQDNFHWVVLEMNRILGYEPLFHVVPGDYDYTYQTENELQAYASVKSWCPAPGNHDLADLDMSNYVVDQENARLIFVNEYRCHDAIQGCDCSAGRICEHTLAWLATQLDGSHPFTFVVGHEPAFPQYRHIGDSLDANPTERDAFWQLLNDRGVYAYICGHTHYYSTYSDATGPTIQIDCGNAGNPGEPEQTFVVFEVTDSDVTWQVYRGLRGEPFDDGLQAYNPSPEDGAENVSVGTNLSWSPGSGAVWHHVYVAATQEELGLPGTLAYSGAVTSCDPEPDLDFETQYWWRVDEEDSLGNVVAGAAWNFTTGPETMLVVAAGETSVDGFISGSYLDTYASDDICEEITEVLNVPNKNGYSQLEHIWTFDVPAGSFVEFYVEARRSPSADGDNFEFSYSTDGSTYHHMLTVTEIYDVQQSFTLSSDTAGTVYIKATDTDHTRKNQDFDTLFVDSMCVVSSQIPIPDYKASAPNPTDGAADVAVDAVLSWTPGAGEPTHNVYLGTDPGLANPTFEDFGLVSPSYDPPEDLSQGTVYYWRVDEVSEVGVETGTVWSFTTYADPGTPTTMTASVAVSTLRRNPPEDFGLAVVTVTDNLGTRVSGATVKGYFTGDFSDDFTAGAVTDPNGQVVFTTSTDVKKPLFGFELDSVTHPDLKWLP